MTAVQQEENQEVEVNKYKEFVKFLRDLIIIIAIVLFIRTYIASPFKISGSSMEENYHDGEYILVDKFSYADFGFKKVGDPKRGDVVILRPHAQKDKEYYIKRVIGLPGDTIWFKDGEVYIKKAWATEAVKLSEAYLSATNLGRTFLPSNVSETNFTVPEGEYFVMGDNRNYSADSRSCFLTCSSGAVLGHFLKREDVVGKVFLDFGAFKILEWTPETGIRFAKDMGWTTAPKFLNTVREWTYPELGSSN